MAAENFDGIKKIQTVGKRSLESLESVNLHEKFDPFLVVILALKLDGFTAKAWDRFRDVLAETFEQATNNGEAANDRMQLIPSWTEFDIFLTGERDMYIRDGLRQQLTHQSTCNAFYVNGSICHSDAMHSENYRLVNGGILLTNKVCATNHDFPLVLSKNKLTIQS